MNHRQKTTTLLKCPVCNRKLWLSNVVSHRKQRHPELTHSEFEAKLVAGIKSGKIKPRKFEPAKNGPESGTQKLSNAKQKYKAGISGMVQGGRTSPK